MPEVGGHGGLLLGLLHQQLPLHVLPGQKLCLPGGQESVLPAPSRPDPGRGEALACLRPPSPPPAFGPGHSASVSALQLQVVPEKGFEVLRRVFVDFEGISLRRKFLHGLEPENIHMMIGKAWAAGFGHVAGGLWPLLLIFFTELSLLHFYAGSMTIDCLGILNDLSDCEDKLFPIGYQYVPADS